MNLTSHLLHCHTNLSFSLIHSTNCIQFHFFTYFCIQSARVYYPKNAVHIKHGLSKIMHTGVFFFYTGVFFFLTTMGYYIHLHTEKFINEYVNVCNRGEPKMVYLGTLKGGVWVKISYKTLDLTPEECVRKGLEWAWGKCFDIETSKIKKIDIVPMLYLNEMYYHIYAEAE